MNIKANTLLPEFEFFVLSSDGPKKLVSTNVFKEKKILLVGVPGAFTPTCSDDHIPAFIDNFLKFKEKGIEEMYCISANDPFVMTEWGKSYGQNEINFISDGENQFQEKTGLSLDLSSIGLGKRLSRFAIVLDNLTVVSFFDESGGGLKYSKAENILLEL
tara:strand:+ start:156 stop:635 length:480 start_codon:yes stop_codon:yes gene_type:complete